MYQREFGRVLRVGGIQKNRMFDASQGMSLNKVSIYSVYQSHPVHPMWNQMQVCSVKFTSMDYVTIIILSMDVSERTTAIAAKWTFGVSAHIPKSVDATVDMSTNYFFLFFEFCNH